MDATAGQEIRGGDTNRTFDAATYTFTPQGGTAGGRAVYVECRRLPGEAVVVISQDVPVDTYASQAAARDVIIGPLTLPAAGADSTAVAVPTVPAAVATAATTSRTTVAATGPTQDPACAGVAEWIDTVAQFGTELAAIFQPIYEGFQRANQVQAANGLRAAPPAVENLLIRFQQIPVPALAAEVHAKIVANLQLMVDGLYQWRSGFETANQSDYFAGTQKVTEAEQKMAALQPELQKIADQCGLKLPMATPVR